MMQKLLYKLRDEIAQTSNAHLTIYYVNQRNSWVVMISLTQKIENTDLKSAIQKACLLLISKRKKVNRKVLYTL